MCKRLSISVAFTIALMFVLTSLGTAFADSPGSSKVTMRIVAGTLSDRIGDLTLVSTSNGTATFTLPIMITDATGSGNGWSLLIDSQDVLVTGYSVEAVGSSSLPITSLSYPVSNNGVIMNAGRDFGMGMTKVIFTMQVPASGTSTLSFSLSGF